MQFRFLVAASIVALSLAAAAQMPDKIVPRPRITGISHIAVYTSDPTATEHYYVDIIGAPRVADPEDTGGARYMVNATQFVEVLPLPSGQGINRVDHTAYITESAEGMRKYLLAKGWNVPAGLNRGADGSRWFTVLDPEGNKVQFVQPPVHPVMPPAPNLIGKHIIHLGLMVHSRDKEDAFYRQILGFRPYWYGGMVDTRTDWVSQQTPDSHDWLEYMLTFGSTPVGESKGIPATMSQHDLGVLDHLSIGVPSVTDAYKALEASNRLGGVHDGHTQIGKDGKGQFNLYDPDGIRLELMNFHATEKPCCSPFTAEDPAE
jgi:catechol 2,3-dioxygenase-like lactoylglutathione lyase family enzyme